MFGRMIKDRAHAAVIYGVMMAMLLGRRRRWPSMRRSQPSAATAGLAVADGRQPRGKGSTPGAGRLGDLGGDHDGHVQRLGQCDARQLPAAGRIGSDGADDAQRRFQRHRRRLPEHADVRHRGRLPRRADGGPDARIPRQEDRGQGGQAGHAGGLDPSALDHRAGPPSSRRPTGGPRPRPTPARTASARSSTSSPRPSANNGSGFEGLSDNNPAWNIATGVVLLLGPVPGALAADRDRGLPGPEETHARTPRERC